MIDVAASVGKDPLPESFGIGPDHLKEALDKQGVDIDPLDVVLVRTGTGGVWLDGSGVGANNSEVEAPDLAGITVEGAKWLVEQKGALALGSDTSSLEVRPPKDQLEDGTSFNPVHIYLLARQGVHVLEYQNLDTCGGQSVQVRLYPRSQQDPRRDSWHGAPPDRHRLRANFGESPFYEVG